MLSRVNSELVDARIAPKSVNSCNWEVMTVLCKGGDLGSEVGEFRLERCELGFGLHPFLVVRARAQTVRGMMTRGRFRCTSCLMFSNFKRLLAWKLAALLARPRNRMLRVHACSSKCGPSLGIENSPSPNQNIPFASTTPRRRQGS
jgi:hypothetical protein